VKWDVSHSVASLGARATVATSLESLIESIRHEARSGDHVLIMSNGGFGGVHGKLLQALKN
jgi:UDP-N-acetylmuramate: L-alanyl-gamma-D-glutamyl-meso-diaminopimelate ligase